MLDNDLQACDDPESCASLNIGPSIMIFNRDSGAYGHDLSQSNLWRCRPLHAHAGLGLTLCDKYFAPRPNLHTNPAACQQVCVQPATVGCKRVGVCLSGDVSKQHCTNAADVDT